MKGFPELLDRMERKKYRLFEFTTFHGVKQKGELMFVFYHFLTSFVLSATVLLTLSGGVVPELKAQQTPDKRALYADAQAVFLQGLQQEGDQRRQTMRKAAQRFLYLVERFNIKNGHLYFNIGNAYYYAGEKGKALRYYRKAERLIPNSWELQRNMEQVETELHLQPPPRNWQVELMQAFFFWHYLLDHPQKRLIAVSLFVLVWILLIIRLFRKSLLIHLLLFAVLIMEIGIGTSFAISSYQLIDQKRGLVTRTETVARKGPGTTYDPAFDQALTEGTEFEIVERKERWWKVQSQGGEIFWLRAADIESY